MAFPKRRRRIDLALNGAGAVDVPFGARARRRARRRIAVGLIGLVLVGGAIGLYVWLVPGASASPRGKYPVLVRCEACDRDVVVRVPFQSRFPVACPFCKRLTAYPVWACRDCGTRFLPDPEASVQHCPHCNSINVGTAVPAPDE